MSMIRTICTSLLLGLSFLALGQYAQLQLGDTIKVTYPFHLPILGEETWEKGFDLPRPVGIMLNYFMASQDIAIPEISLGFSDGGLPYIPMTDISDIVEFGEVHTVAHYITVRPDVWILPFLNLYGIFGKAYSHTQVRLDAPIQMEANAHLEGNSYGFGTTCAFGLGKYFVVLDGNWVWTSMSNFREPVRSAVFSQRIGRAFPIGKNPESNISVWAGGMRLSMRSLTEGSVLAGDIFPDNFWNHKDEIIHSYSDWYDALNPNNPLDVAKISVVENNGIDNMVNWLENQVVGSGKINYHMAREPAREWNIILGGQYQLNKNWQFRVEGGIIGNRKSLLLSTNYRFGI